MCNRWKLSLVCGVGIGVCAITVTDQATFTSATTSNADCSYIPTPLVNHKTYVFDKHVSSQASARVGARKFALSIVKTDMRNFRFFRCFRFFGLQIDGLRDQCESVEISKCILRGGGSLLIVQLVFVLLMQKVITNASILFIAYIFS